MNDYLQVEDEAIRISDSPRRSPRIKQAYTSPIRSIHATQMESLNSQQDIGMRTTDFFEDDSSEEAILHDTETNLAPDADLLDRGALGEKKQKRLTASTTDGYVTQCDGGTSKTKPDLLGYQRLSANETGLGPNIIPDTASSSFRGSVEELLPSGQHSSPPQMPQIRTTGTANEFSPGTTKTAQSYRVEQGHASVPATAPKVEQTLGAYAIAHEITLNALMRDEKALNDTLETFALAPLSAEGRQSVLPQTIDPRSPRVARNSSASPATTTTKKSVQLVPPPIDTSATKRSIPDDIVRTPYPFTSDQVKHKNFGADIAAERIKKTETESFVESILTISIAQNRANRKSRVTTIMIPATNDFTALQLSSVGAKERHFKALDFDDAKFFSELRKCYRELYGLARFFSARSLSRIAVSGNASKPADVCYGWRSPRLVASKVLQDTFSEDQILRHYRCPVQGRSRYVFVHWAHRLAAATSNQCSDGNTAVIERKTDDPLRRKETHEGLVFILTWSIVRILLVLSLVIVLSVASALLWIFLGRDTTDTGPLKGDFGAAGDRVGTGMLIGVCVLLLGLSSMAGWLGVSWLII